MTEPLPSTLEPGGETTHLRIEFVDLTEPARAEHPLFLLGMAVGAAAFSVRCLWRAVKAAAWRRKQHRAPAMGPYRS